MTLGKHLLQSIGVKKYQLTKSDRSVNIQIDTIPAWGREREHKVNPNPKGICK